MEDNKISEQLLSIYDLLRDIEVSTVNNIKLILEKTNNIREITNELMNKKL